MTEKLVRQNIVLQVEDLTATEQKICVERFRRMDPLRVAPEKARDRNFWVDYEDGLEPYSKDNTQWWYSQANYTLHVVYQVGPKGLSHDRAHDLILSDAYDLKRRLYDDIYFTGSLTNATQSVGLNNRVHEKSALTQNDDYWIYSISLRCDLQE